MNEPKGWTFLCIWYENRGNWVHEVKRHCFSFYMALCIPIHLRQRTSRVYQDHLHFCRVLTSFVPPVHNQGVSLAPLQGHALWNIFLPTTGSFFVSNLTDLFCRFSDRHLSADVFPAPSPASQPSCPGWIQLLIPLLKSSIQPRQGIACFFPVFYAACICGLFISPISFLGS